MKSNLLKTDVDERIWGQVVCGGIGAGGQRRLTEARVAIVGCGATGSSLAAMLARAGVGMLRIVDRDYVEASNLQRQTLFDEIDCAESLPKAIAACRKIAAFNSHVVVEPPVSELRPVNAQALLGGVHLILDGTDNFETRYLLNDYAVRNSVPWIYTAAVGSYPITINVIPGDTARLTCVFPQSPSGVIETFETAGILNSAVNFAASIAATEAIKLLTGAQNQLRRTLLSYDLRRNERGEVSVATPKPDCKNSGRRALPH